MSVESRLTVLERAAKEREPAAIECITVATVIGDLQIPASALPAIEKIYGDGARNDQMREFDRF